MTIKTFQNKNFIMRFTQILASIWMILIFSSCRNDLNRLSAINSESFNEKQINLFLQPGKKMETDFVDNNGQSILTNDQHLVVNQLDEMIAMTKLLRKSESDSIWLMLTKKWTEFNVNNFGTEKLPIPPNSLRSDSLHNKIFPEEILKWAELNIDLVKLSGEVKFGDALEKIIYSPANKFNSERLLKSIIYTHVFDKIFINIIGASSMDYQHTTGGNVRIIQETDYPNGNEMTLKSECNDLRYMDVFIRIPSWAVNPTVTHGNVKYVARPGEYCQISRKWLTGDEIRVVLKNQKIE